MPMGIGVPKWKMFKRKIANKDMKSNIDQESTPKLEALAKRNDAKQKGETCETWRCVHRALLSFAPHIPDDYLVHKTKRRIPMA